MLFNENEVDQNELDRVMACIPADEESIESSHLERIFFARFPHEIFKAPNIDEKESSLANIYYWNGKCIPRSKKDIGALKKGQSALKRGQLKKCQI